MYDEDGLKIDPIEKDPQHKAIFEKIDDEVEEYIKKEMPNAPRGMGYCHLFWDKKQELLKSKYKIKWRTPAEMNPEILFD